jgi:hypothetical protein
MARRCDEVQQNMHTVVAEARVTLDTRLLGDNAVVLALEVSDDFLEATSRSARTSSLQPGNIPGLVVDLVTESGCVDDGQ